MSTAKAVPKNGGGNCTNCEEKECKECEDNRTVGANASTKDYDLGPITSFTGANNIWNTMLTYCYQGIGTVEAWIEGYLNALETFLKNQNIIPNDADLSFGNPNAVSQTPLVKSGDIFYSATGKGKGQDIGDVLITKQCDVKGNEGPDNNGLFKISGERPFSAPARPVPIDGGASLLLAAGAAYGLKRLKGRKKPMPSIAYA